MQQAQQMKPIGDILKTFGANGELIIKVRADIPRAILKNKEPVFIHIDGLTVPFYMKYAESKGTSKLIVIFEDMETATLAAELVGKSIYLFSKGANDLPSSEFDMFIGFTAVDDTCQVLGTVKEVMDIPGNPCLIIEDLKGNEAILPLNQKLIVNIDSQKKQIRLHIPNGLLELYS